jgi:DNA-binding response OmpR family regulator
VSESSLPITPAITPSRSILVIEDEPTIAEAVALRLRSEGFGVDIAADGPAGVDASERLSPDLVVGLATGADDYLTKPFSGRELVARVRALLRRVERATEISDATELVLGDVALDLAGRRVTRAGEPVHLTPTEFDLLVFLARRPGQVFTREQLLGEVWGYRDGSGARTVDSHVRALRRKLGAEFVRTVHGVGYAAGDVARGSAA